MTSGTERALKAIDAEVEARLHDRPDERLLRACVELAKAAIVNFDPDLTGEDIVSAGRAVTDAIAELEQAAGACGD